MRQVSGWVGAGDFEARGGTWRGVVGADRRLLAGFAVDAAEVGGLGVVLGADLKRVGAVAESGGVQHVGVAGGTAGAGREAAGEFAASLGGVEVALAAEVVFLEQRAVDAEAFVAQARALIGGAPARFLAAAHPLAREQRRATVGEADLWGRGVGEDEGEGVGVDLVGARAITAGGAHAGHLEDEAAEVAVGAEGPEVGAEGVAISPADPAEAVVGDAGALHEDVVGGAVEAFGPEAPAPTFVEGGGLAGVAAAGEDQDPGRDGPGDLTVGAFAGVAGGLVLGDLQEGVVAGRIGRGAAGVFEVEDAGGVLGVGGVGRRLEAVGAVVAGAEEEFVVGGVGSGSEGREDDEGGGDDEQAELR